MRALVLSAILLASCGGETESTPVDDADTTPTRDGTKKCCRDVCK